MRSSIISQDPENEDEQTNSVENEESSTTSVESIDIIMTLCSENVETGWVSNIVLHRLINGSLQFSWEPRPTRTPQYAVLITKERDGNEFEVVTSLRVSRYYSPLINFYQYGDDNLTESEPRTVFM